MHVRHARDLVRRARFGNPRPSFPVTTPARNAPTVFRSRPHDLARCPSCLVWHLGARVQAGPCCSSRALARPVEPEPGGAHRSRSLRTCAKALAHQHARLARLVDSGQYARRAIESRARVDQDLQHSRSLCFSHRIVMTTFPRPRAPSLEVFVAAPRLLPACRRDTPTAAPLRPLPDVALDSGARCKAGSHTPCPSRVQCRPFVCSLDWTCI